ncbi:PapD-like protein [Boletus coccyginus]|nr:PapD-like protein [Boletus coccyginus]
MATGIQAVTLRRKWNRQGQGIGSCDYIPSPPRSSMSVHLVPNNELGFNRPFTQVVKKVLLVSNQNSAPVAFKFYATAPRLYYVRPNSGRIEPGDSVEVSIMLQPMKEEPPLSAKCKDKLRIQSTLITSEKETKDLQDIWNVPSGAGDEWRVHYQKLRVVHLPPESQIDEEEESHVEEPPSVPASRRFVVEGGRVPQLEVPDPKPTSDNLASSKRKRRTIGEWFGTVIMKRNHKRTPRQTPSDAPPQSAIASQTKATSLNEKYSTMAPVREHGSLVPCHVNISFSCLVFVPSWICCGRADYSDGTH